ncbi:MAG: aromatic amino acid ammonia-lyase, partial [Actinobacteria bacterium]|nr:aromatic amino acid ammonia-lyase [Actinomycetota bacterium]
PLRCLQAQLGPPPGLRRCTLDVVTIGESPLGIEELLEVVRGVQVELDPYVRSQILASRAVVDDALSGVEPVYGLNTGVGHQKDVRLSEEELRTQQEMLVMTHAGGVGPPLSTELVRAAIMTRLNGIARGGSGVSPAVADILAEMLNAGVHPIVPLTGSVGAGDLGQMASVALVVIGKGTAEFNGGVLSGAEALRRAGIDQLTLGPKDGLGLMSANGISIGHAAVVISRIARAAEAADVAVGLSLEATEGNASITLPVVGRAKPYSGQIEAAQSIRSALDGSYLLGGASRSVQDALSFRVAPQVHGALREAMAFARRSVEIELNSMSDNPLVSLDDRTMVHNGNFHPIVLAIAFDGVRVALAHVGQLIERRLSHLWDTVFENLAASPEGTPGVPMSRVHGRLRGASAFHGLSLRYPAAAIFSELKQLAAPATLDSSPLDVGTEDHATDAPLSVRKADEAVSLLQDLIVIELLMARDALATTRVARDLGATTGKALRTVDETIDADLPEQSPSDIHRSLRAAMFDDITYKRRGW